MELKNNRIWKSFGLIYSLIHLIFFIALLALIHGSNYNFSFDPDIILAAFPVFGILAGYWIWKGRYGWRQVIIIPSLLSACAILFSAVFIAPELDKAKQLKHKQLQQDKSLSDADQKLLDAVLNRSTAVAKKAIQEGADPNLIDPESGMSPLYSADLETAEILIEAGADINMRSNENNTPLIWYTYSNHQKGIDYLLSLGADINAINSDGNTALDIADHFGPPDLIRFLQNRGAKKNGDAAGHGSPP